MNKLLCSLVALYIVVTAEPVIAQKLISNSAVTGVCYAGKKTHRIYIPPPQEFFKKSGKGGASITVLYSGFTAQPKAAVEYAASILETLLPADTRIIISASWEPITTSGVLANSSITGYASGWSIDAQNPHVEYPIALAEKISGKSLNDSLAPEITLRINNAVNWYLGTDGNTPGTRYDLVSVVLHELCHGLGFFDSMNTNSTIGWYGVDSVPLIYDSYIETLQGKRLTDTLAFQNYSAALRSQLTGGNLYFNGPLLKTYTSGSRARIYAPSTWDSGSSISHLDEIQTFEPNTLMTPFLDMGEAIHDPGKFTFSILGDLGWINTRIVHTEGRDTEEHLSSLSLSVRIISDTLYDHNTVEIVYSFNKFATSDTLAMTSAGVDDNYNCIINLPSFNTGVQYYFFATDCFERIYRSPSLSDSIRYSIYVGTDTVRPVITHIPVTSLLEGVDTITLTATATDNLGIDSVYAEYRVNNGPSMFIGLTGGKGNGFSAVINAMTLALNGGDSIQYRIFALDSAKIHNSTVIPVSGYFNIHIEDLTAVLERYSTDFTGEAASDFINDGFRIYRPLGFTHYGLNSKHPYESPEVDNETFNYTSILRHPVKINESGLLVSFNEIVLVEPGTTGSVFGSEDFFDYVIVEASKNFGRNWFRLADGYDSRFLNSWETAYNNSIDGNNSTAKGNESMLHKHSILYSPSENVSSGDTLLIRFRLFSDPYANGWGWVIEDLNINAFIDAVENVKTDISAVAYPNPGPGLIRITSDEISESRQPVRYNIFNTSGMLVKSGYLENKAQSVIDISDRQTGLYIIVLNGDGWIKTIKYSLLK